MFQCLIISIYVFHLKTMFLKFRVMAGCDVRERREDLLHALGDGQAAVARASGFGSFCLC